MLDLLMQRRSIRRFQKKQVTADKIEYLIKSTLLAPSSRNIRPWEFIIVKDGVTNLKLADAKQHGSEFLKNAPLAIVILGEPQKSDVWIEDCAIAGIILQLAAEKIGLGSCWVQIRERMHNDKISSEQYIKELLKIPDEKSIASIIGIGYSAEKREPYSENDLKYNKVFLDNYLKKYLK